MKYILLITFSGILFSCSDNYDYVLDGSQLESFEVEPDLRNDGVKIKLEGYFDCNTTFSINQDDSSLLSYDIVGSIDTIFRTDWYQNKLSFDLDPKSCYDKNDVKIMVKLYK